VTVWGTFFNEHEKFIKSSFLFITTANVTRRGLYFTFTITLVTMVLHLLYKSSTESSHFKSESFTITMRTFFDIIWIIGSRSSTMWTNGLPCIFHLHFFPFVQVLQWYF
jgi:hypothetical protein